MKTEWERDYDRRCEEWMDRRFLTKLSISDEELNRIHLVEEIERPDPDYSDYYERHSKGLDLAALAGALFCGIVFSWICYEVWAWLLGVTK